MHKQCSSYVWNIFFSEGELRGLGRTIPKENHAKLTRGEKSTSPDIVGNLCLTEKNILAKLKGINKISAKLDSFCLRRLLIILYIEDITWLRGDMKFIDLNTRR